MSREDTIAKLEVYLGEISMIFNAGNCSSLIENYLFTFWQFLFHYKNSIIHHHRYQLKQSLHTMTNWIFQPWMLFVTWLKLNQTSLQQLLDCSLSEPKQRIPKRRCLHSMHSKVSRQNLSAKNVDDNKILNSMTILECMDTLGPVFRNEVNKFKVLNELVRIN